MKTVGQVMTNAVLTLPPEASVAAAIKLALRHQIDAIPILDADAVVGIVTAHDLLGEALYRPLREVMNSDLVPIDANAPVTAALAAMERLSVGHLPVVDAGRLIGMITRHDVLRELGGGLIDPLTNLAGPGVLRTQATDLVAGGHEIAIIHVDLDRFDAVNEGVGSAAGDRLLAAVADLLRAGTDQARDLPVRYGSDEFAVLTTRRLEEARALGRTLLDAITSLTLPEIGERTIRASMGIAGGRRVRERPSAYPAAVVDDLITLARRASSPTGPMALETLDIQSVPMPPLVPSGRTTRLRLASLSLVVRGSMVQTRAELERAGRRSFGEAAGDAAADGVSLAVAKAVAAAATHLLPRGWTVEVEILARIRASLGEAIVLVAAVITPQGRTRCWGIAPASVSRPEAPARAVLRALDRRLGALWAASDHTHSQRAHGPTAGQPDHGPPPDWGDSRPAMEYNRGTRRE